MKNHITFIQKVCYVLGLLICFSKTDDITGQLKWADDHFGSDLSPVYNIGATLAIFKLSGYILCLIQKLNITPNVYIV